jgi:hypothetical protein
MSPSLAGARPPQPPDSVLAQLRIPFVRRATLHYESVSEEAFLIDIGLAGVFIERREPLATDGPLEVEFSWPGSEIPFRAQCRVAWWHAEGAPLSSKSLPPGAGLQFTGMSGADRERLRAYLLDYCSQNPRVRRFLRHWPEAERQGDDPTS